MTTAAPEDTVAFSADLYALLRLIDPASYRDELDAEARARLDAIKQRARALLADASSAESAPAMSLVRARIEAVYAALERAVVETPSASRAFWQRVQREVHPTYEALAAALRSGHAVAPVLRPTNYARSVFHVISALVAVGVIVASPSQGWIIAAASLFFTFSWTCEISRRISPAMNDRLMRLFGPVAHAHEWHKVNSATWYSTALMALSLTTRPAIAAAAVTVLGFADPAAGMIGRRYGRIKIRAGRTLEGSLAFLVVAVVSAFGALSVLSPMPLGTRVLCAVVGGVVGALAELFASGIDDNLAVPVAVAAAISLVG